MGARKPVVGEKPLIDDQLTEYREVVMVAAYECLISCLTGKDKMVPDIDQACQLGHLLKELGLV